jgi:hypothetical protein
MSETVTHIVANGGGAAASAPARNQTQPTKPPASQQAAPPPSRPAGWIPVVAPGTTAVVIALVSEHGVLATVPSNASAETKAAAVARHNVDVVT